VAAKERGIKQDIGKAFAFHLHLPLQQIFATGVG
jgi:hypothetical protein